MMEDIEDFELRILECLSDGMNQGEIPEHFKKMEVTPNSASIIEKRLNSMKKKYNCKTVYQLIHKATIANII